MSEPPRTFWLSFVDPDRPQGQQFLGACLVDVTAADLAAAYEALAARYGAGARGADAIAIAAAIRVAWREGCNPGGQVASVDVTGAPELARYPKDDYLLDTTNQAAYTVSCEPEPTGRRLAK